MNKNIRKILVVDDEMKIVEVVKSYLESSGFSVYEENNFHSGIDMDIKS